MRQCGVDTGDWRGEKEGNVRAACSLCLLDVRLRRRRAHAGQAVPGQGAGVTLLSRRPAWSGASGSLDRVRVCRDSLGRHAAETAPGGHKEASIAIWCLISRPRVIPGAVSPAPTPLRQICRVGKINILPRVKNKFWTNSVPPLDANKAGNNTV